MKQARLLRAVVVLVALGTAGQALASDAMDSVARELARLTQDRSGVLRLQRKQDGSLVLSRPSERPVSSAEGKRASEKLPATMLRLEERTLVMTFGEPKGHRVMLRIADEGKGAEQWAVKDCAQVATIPGDQRGAFSRLLADSPVAFWRETITKDERSAEVGFQSPCPDEVKLGSHRIALSPKLRNYLKPAANGVYDTGATNAAVVIVHEPHWDTVGQYLELAGLHELLSSNTLDPVFAIEGGVQNQRYEVASLLALLPSGEARSSALYALVQAHLVDGPSAYMALYGPNIQAWGIENKQQYEKPAPSAVLDPASLLPTLVLVAEAVDKRSSTDPEVAAAFLLLQATIAGDVGDCQGRELVALHERKATATGQLIDLCESHLDAAHTIPDWPKHRQRLRMLQQAFAKNKASYEQALCRDPFMAQGIVSLAKSGKVVFAFVGNFHTTAIAERLRKEGISYLVVEPVVGRQRLAEMEAYQRVLDPATRAAYVRGLKKIPPGMWGTMPSQYRRIAAARPRASSPAEGEGAPAEMRPLLALLARNPYLREYRTRVGQATGPFGPALLSVDARLKTVTVSPEARATLAGLGEDLADLPFVGEVEGVTNARTAHRLLYGATVINVLYDSAKGVFSVYEGKGMVPEAFLDQLAPDDRCLRNGFTLAPGSPQLVAGVAGAGGTG